MDRIEKIVRKQKRFFERGMTKQPAFREKALIRLEKVIHQYEEEIYEALKTDLNKSRTEAYMTEVGFTLSEISHTRRNFKIWQAPRHVRSPLAQFHASSYVVKEPYGTVLIMAPWNYPFQLCLAPLVGAIAAGNCCVLKPSAYAPAVSAILAKLIKEAFPSSYIAVVEGGRKENQELLEQEFDYIFFTGSVDVGKLVMEKASRNLTPVTLELGGKSPCLVDASADLDLAAKRIAFGKYLNSGQTCVAPDYLLIQESVKEEFLVYLKKWIRRMYGQRPLEQGDYPKMINEKHYDRIMGLISGEHVVIGGKADRDTLQIAPTVLDNITAESPVMQEEIFGPVMPVITYRTLDEAEQFIKRYPKPLALYLFTNTGRVRRRIQKNISFGGGCINDTIIHLATPYMGFGGVGASGMGSYHGRKGFVTFTHEKSIVRKYNWIDLPIRYRPYTELKDKLIRIFLR